MEFRSARFSSWIGASALLFLACAEGQDLNFPAPGAGGSGDQTGTGGASGVGGSSNGGGAGNGGSTVNTGGSSAGTGGAVGGGGSAGRGGAGGSGGSSGTAVTGTGGSLGTGGTSGTGGTVGTGGCSASSPFDGGVSGTVLFSDDFEGDGGSGHWLQQSTGGTATWSIVAADAGSKVYSGAIASSSAIALAVNGSTGWSDVSVEAKIRVRSFPSTSTSYFAGLCVRVVDPLNFTCVALRSDGRIGIRARTAGASPSNVSGADVTVSPAITTNVWYSLKVVVRGSAISIYFNGATVPSETITPPGCTPGNGAIALAIANGTAEFDDVKVTVP